MSQVHNEAPSPDRILRPAAGVVAREMGHATILVHLDTNRIFELNTTGTRIWTWLQQGASPSSVRDRLRTEFPGAADLDATVDRLLADLLHEGLIGA